MIVEHFDRNLDARFYAGEPIELELQLTDAAGAVESLAGRAFALTLFRADRTQAAGVRGVRVTGVDEHASFVLAGSVSEGLIGQTGLFYEVAEILDNGRDVIASGRMHIAASASSTAGAAGAVAAGGPLTRFTRKLVANAPRIVISQRGGRGVRGDQGETGPRGLQGDIGPRGLPGVDGVGVSNGFLTLGAKLMSELGSPVGSAGKIALVTNDPSGPTIAVAIGGDWRRLATAGVVPAPLFDFGGQMLPSGVTFARNSQATYFDANGLMQIAAVDAPRFVTSGILLEPSATNLQINSDQLDLVFNTSGTKTPNDRAAPTGFMTADKFVLSTGQVLTRLNAPIAAGATGIFSIYAYVDAAGAGTWRLNSYGNASGDANVDVQLVANQFTRVALTKTFAAGDTDRRFSIFRGAGVAAGTIWLSALQAETGALMTSYIPTAGASATRAADALTLPWGARGVADGQITVRYTFDNDTTQDVLTTVSGGVATVPTNLNRSILKRAEKV